MYKLNKLSKRDLKKLKSKEVDRLFDDVDRFQRVVQDEYYRRQRIAIDKRMKEYWNEQRKQSNRQNQAEEVHQVQ